MGRRMWGRKSPPPTDPRATLRRRPKAGRQLWGSRVHCVPPLDPATKPCLVTGEGTPGGIQGPRRGSPSSALQTPARAGGYPGVGPHSWAYKAIPLPWEEPAQLRPCQGRLPGGGWRPTAAPHLCQRQRPVQREQRMRMRVLSQGETPLQSQDTSMPQVESLLCMDSMSKPLCSPKFPLLEKQDASANPWGQ